MTTQNMTTNALKPPVEGQQLLFVYGSLRPSLQSPLNISSTTFALLEGNYKLLTSNYAFLPYLVRTKDDFNVIKGEVIWVDTSSKEFLDIEHVEKHAGYHLEIINVKILNASEGTDAKNVEALAFMYPENPVDTVFPYYDIPKDETGVLDFIYFYKNRDKFKKSQEELLKKNLKTKAK